MPVWAAGFSWAGGAGAPCNAWPPSRQQQRARLQNSRPWRQQALAPCSSEPLTCDVIHHHRNGGISDVAGDEAAEAFLPCSVPAE
jgi:hypothetical protein